jgi:hypothetical protein
MQLKHSQTLCTLRFNTHTPPGQYLSECSHLLPLPRTHARTHGVSRYADLEELRARKAGGTTGFSGRTASEPTNSASAQTRGANRRYLIMTFSTEFDRVHFPLPLDYCGRPDPSQLQAVIHQLRAEATAATETTHRTAAALAELQAAYDRTAAERDALQRQVEALQRLQHQQQVESPHIALTHARSLSPPLPPPLTHTHTHGKPHTLH